MVAKQKVACARTTLDTEVDNDVAKLTIIML